MPLETVALGITVGAGNGERETERQRGRRGTRVATEEGTCGEERAVGRESTEAGGIYRWKKRREGGQKERTRGRKRQNEIRSVGGDEGRERRGDTRCESACARERERKREGEGGRGRERGRERGETTRIDQGEIKRDGAIREIVELDQ